VCVHVGLQPMTEGDVFTERRKTSEQRHDKVICID
jgi:hypothetical protein